MGSLWEASTTVDRSAMAKTWRNCEPIVVSRDELTRL